MRKAIYYFLLFSGVQTSLFSQINNDVEDATPITKPRVRLVILKTSDVTLTQNHFDRLKDIGEYVEDYFVDQLISKGYSQINTNLFARNTDGEILIYVARSNKSSSAIYDPTYTGAEIAMNTYPDLTDRNSVWAIAHFKQGGGFSGGGNISRGRMRFELKDAEGSIDFSSNMSSTDYHRDISLKAIHHELGHAFTVLHNGPLRTNTAFNTLMGPVNNAYEKKVGVAQTLDVQLSDYTAAIIAFHPVLRNSAFSISQLNGKRIKIEKILGDNDLFTVDCTTGIAHVRGRVKSNLPFHHVVIRFSFQGEVGSGGRWNSSFAVNPDSNGVFDLELNQSDINMSGNPTLNFEYEVMVAFNNGLTRGVEQLEVWEEINTDLKFPHVNPYSFNTDNSIVQTISVFGGTISTDYHEATSYQWIDCNTNNPISGATSESFSPESNGNYAVKITAPNGCTHTSDCYELTTFSINKNVVSNKFEVYPNPSNDNITIISKNSTIQSVEIFNLTGKSVYKNDLKPPMAEVTVKSPDKGVYVLRIRSNKGSHSIKIISSE